MIVTIWRHGQAGNAVRDRDRELTESGLDDVGFGCSQFLQLCEQRGIPVPDLILYSRWLRTSQTADIIGSRLPHAGCEACEALIPGQRSPLVDSELQRRAQGGTVQHVVLVSHQPLVSSLIDHYLDDPGRVAPLVPGAFASLQLEIAATGCGRLLFSAQPPEFEGVL